MRSDATSLVIAGQIQRRMEALLRWDYEAAGPSARDGADVYHRVGNLANLPVRRVLAKS